MLALIFVHFPPYCKSKSIFDWILILLLLILLLFLSINSASQKVTSDDFLWNTSSPPPQDENFSIKGEVMSSGCWATENDEYRSRVKGNEGTPQIHQMAVGWLASSALYRLLPVKIGLYIYLLHYFTNRAVTNLVEDCVCLYNVFIFMTITITILSFIGENPCKIMAVRRLFINDNNKKKKIIF